LACTAPERRQARRAKVMLAAAVRHAELAISIRFRNLSSTGALVEGEALPAEGSSVLLQHNGQLLRSHVVWADGNRGGIRFEQPRDLDASLRHVASRRIAWSPRPTRPGLKCKPLSEGEIRTYEQWLTLGVTALGD
jgi:hypothetical protein